MKLTSFDGVFLFFVFKYPMPMALKMGLNQMMLSNKIEMENEVCVLREINGKLQLEIGNQYYRLCFPFFF